MKDKEKMKIVTTSGTRLDYIFPDIFTMNVKCKNVQ